jgi:hypothetical protein
MDTVITARFVKKTFGIDLIKQAWHLVTKGSCKTFDEAVSQLLRNRHTVGFTQTMTVLTKHIVPPPNMDQPDNPAT